VVALDLRELKDNMKKKEEVETYNIQVHCSNCTYGKIFPRFFSIPRGTMVKSALLFEECPNCGCETLKESY
jgi:Zn finger protein HypA/HybF involved in hydrogenase expression